MTASPVPVSASAALSTRAAAVELAANPRSSPATLCRSRSFWYCWYCLTSEDVLSAVRAVRGWKA